MLAIKRIRKGYWILSLLDQHGGRLNEIPDNCKLSCVPSGITNAAQQGNMTDSLVNHRYTIFKTDAGAGTMYAKVIGRDSVVNKVESLNDIVTVDNQTYPCVRVHVQDFHPPNFHAFGTVWVSYQ